jgi:hypothetical protein
MKPLHEALTIAEQFYKFTAQVSLQPDFADLDNNTPNECRIQDWQVKIQTHSNPGEFFFPSH